LGFKRSGKSWVLSEAGRVGFQAKREELGFKRSGKSWVSSEAGGVGFPEREKREELDFKQSETLLDSPYPLAKS
jgi:hypothetical protein